VCVSVGHHAVKCSITVGRRVEGHDSDRAAGGVAHIPGATKVLMMWWKQQNGEDILCGGVTGDASDDDIAVWDTNCTKGPVLGLGSWWVWLTRACTRWWLSGDIQLCCTLSQMRQRHR
jgi:hypothetical protein